MRGSERVTERRRKSKGMGGTHRQIRIEQDLAERVVEVRELDDELLVPRREARRGRRARVHDERAGDAVGVLRRVCVVVGDNTLVQDRGTGAWTGLTVCL